MDISNIMDASEWKYFAEGNANIIVTYQGTTNKSLHSKALRISKLTRAPILSYTKSVIKTLFGSKYLIDAEEIYVSHSFLSDLSCDIEPNRPISRCHKSINTENNRVVLMENLLSDNSQDIVIELKPKWGFMPKEYNNICRFCIHSRLII
jgi:inositol-pentakisphosphate 2-kinase